MQSQRVEQLFFDNFLLTREALKKNPKYKSNVLKFYNLLDELKSRLPKEDYTLLDKALKVKSEMVGIQDYEIFTTALILGMQLAEEESD